MAVTERSAEQIAETVAMITANGGRALAFGANVRDRQAVAQLVDREAGMAHV